MSVFRMYLELGFSHIADFAGYDHILFLLGLMAAYRFTDWKTILTLVTAFTLGHSLSLALAVLEMVQFSVLWIEWLIPLTIVLTAFLNISDARQHIEKFYRFEYLMAAAFGLIHGLGFSVLLKSLLGAEESIIWPLLAFNLGLELGQLLIVLVILLLAHGFAWVFKFPRRDWQLVVSGMALGIASILLIERWPEAF